MSNHPSTGGRVSVELYRERIGFDYNCGYAILGTVTSTDPLHPTTLGNATFQADISSNRYYLCFYSQAGPTFNGSGTISQ